MLFDNPAISKCFNTMFLLSPNLCFIIGFIGDLSDFSLCGIIIIIIIIIIITLDIFSFSFFCLDKRHTEI